MPSEMEFVNYKEFVESLPETESLDSADKSVISNPTNGPRSMLLAAAIAQSLQTRFLNITQAYGINSSPAYIEETKTANGSIYFKVSSLAERGLVVNTERMCWVLTRYFLLVWMAEFATLC